MWHIVGKFSSGVRAKNAMTARTAFPGVSGGFNITEQGVFMKMPLCLAFAAALCLPALPAGAFPFSFNKATPEIMVEACRDDGITLSPVLARAVVEYREANGPFKNPEDVLKVPGMSELMYQQLNPLAESGDVRFNMTDVPGMATY